MKFGRALFGACLVMAVGCEEGGPTGSEEQEQTGDSGGLMPPRDAGAAADGSMMMADAASTDGSTASGPRQLTVFPMGLAVRSPTHLAAPARIAKRIDPTAAKTLDARQAQLAELLSGTKLADCAVFLQSFLQGAADNVACYGPSLDYKGHPDATMGASAEGQLPGGDLGLWTESEAGGQACAAAKMNGLLDGVSRRVDLGLYAAASFVCTANVEGKLEVSASADGGSSIVTVPSKLDLTSSLATVLGDPGRMTVDAASLEQLITDGSSAYHYTLGLTASSPIGDVVISTEIMHRPDAAVAGTYAGRIWGTMASGGRTEAFSVGYARSEATGRLRYHTVSASYDMTATDVFDSDGRLRVDSNWSGNIAQGLFDMDAATVSEGNGSFAWQAGRGDSHARVLNVFTERGATTLAGCGFFGYGTRFNATAAALSDNAISTFICNWAGPGNQHTGLVGYAQKQCMEQSATGIFVPTTNAIAYAPVNSCSSAAGFEYKLTSETTYTSTPVTSDLVKLADDTDFTKYVAPAAL